MDGRRTTPQGIVSAGIKGLREYAMRSGRKSLGTPQVSQPTKPANMLHTGRGHPHSIVERLGQSVWVTILKLRGVNGLAAIEVLQRPKMAHNFRHCFLSFQ